MLALILSFLPFHNGFGDDHATGSGGEEKATAEATPAAALAAEVSEIAHFKMMSHAKKEKRIANAVRVAVVGATAYKNPAETLNMASDLAVAAANAAPAFKEIIVHAVSFTPSVARIDGASGQIAAAVDDAVAKAANAEKSRQITEGKNRRGTMEAGPAVPPPPEKVESSSALRNEPTAAPPAPAASAIAQTAPPAPSEPISPSENAGVASGAAAGPAADAGEDATATAKTAFWPPTIDLGDNAAVHFTADLGTRYDDNVFLTEKQKTSDEILSAAPGVAFQFGQNSLTSGALSYEESFQHYAHKSAPDAQLGVGSANFGYSDSRLDVKANGAFQQFYQNQENFFIPGQKLLVRRDQLDVGGSAEGTFTEKISAGAGVNYSRTHYRTAGLVDNNSLGWPINLYYAIWPKVDLSGGFSYRETKTAINGPGNRQRDKYYNLGARGEFTPKLSGNFSVGYTTSRVGASGGSDIWAFDGTFNYEMSPKTTWTLTASRDFSTGAQGEQLKSTNLSLGASTFLSPQWQAAVNLAYQNVVYPAVRKDNYGDGAVSVTYIYSKNISATAGYNLRKNSSSVSGAGFTDNILSLSAGLKY